MHNHGHYVYKTQDCKLILTPKMLTHYCAIARRDWITKEQLGDGFPISFILTQPKLNVFANTQYQYT